MRHEVGAILIRREQHEVGEALGHHGRDLSEIIGAALDVLSHEFVDVTVQAVRHRTPPDLKRRLPTTRLRTNKQRDCGCAKVRCGWISPEKETRSMLRS